MYVSLCARVFASEKGLLTVRLQTGRGTDYTYLFLPGKILCTVAMQHCKNQLESELEMGVVCADLIDYIKKIKKLRKKKCFSFPRFHLYVVNAQNNFDESISLIRRGVLLKDSFCVT